MISRANTLFKLCWKTAEGTKIFFEDLSRNASGFEKKTSQQCSGKIKKLGLIIGRLNTVEEKLVEVGRNGLFKSHGCCFRTQAYYLPPVVITPHVQRERGKVIDRGDHIYIYVCGRKKYLNRTLEIHSPFQTFAVGLLVKFID